MHQKSQAASQIHTDMKCFNHPALYTVFLMHKGCGCCELQIFNPQTGQRCLMRMPESDPDVTAH